MYDKKRLYQEMRSRIKPRTGRGPFHFLPPTQTSLAILEAFPRPGAPPLSLQARSHGDSAGQLFWTSRGARGTDQEDDSVTPRLDPVPYLQSRLVFSID